MTDLHSEYAEGANAFLEGKSELDNPYPVDTDAHCSWHDGWIDGQGIDDDDETQPE